MANIYGFTDTWNNGLTTYSAIKCSVTDTASAADSALIDMLVGGTSLFRVQKDGEISTQHYYSARQEWAQGTDLDDTDIDGSNILTLGTDGNYFQISGTQQIDAIASITGAGPITLVFTSARTLTHDGTSFILPGASNITTASGDAAIFVHEGSGNWRCVMYTISAAAYLSNLVEDTTPQLGGDLDAQGNNVADLGDVTFQTGASGGTLRTGTSAADKFSLQAYDVDNTTYRTVLEVDAGNDVILQLIADYFRIEDATDTTKQLRFTLDGMTTAVTSIFDINHTVARTITWGDESGTIQMQPSEGAFADGDKTKLDGIESSADVTDTANVTAAGALMDSELTNLAAVKAIDQSLATTASPTFVQPTVKAVIETRYAVTGTTPAIDPANGGIQTWTLSGNSTPTDSLGDGESVTLHIDDGTAYTITWTSLVDQWIGGSAPTLPTTGYAVIELWKVNTSVYAAYLGDLS